MPRTIRRCGTRIPERDPAEAAPGGWEMSRVRCPMKAQANREGSLYMYCANRFCTMPIAPSRNSKRSVNQRSLFSRDGAELHLVPDRLGGPALRALGCGICHGNCLYFCTVQPQDITVALVAGFSAMAKAGLFLRPLCQSPQRIGAAGLHGTELRQRHAQLRRCPLRLCMSADFLSFSTSMEWHNDRRGTSL
jgi:hypothetical protein